MHLVLFVYQLLLSLCAPLILLGLWCKGLGNRQYLRHWPQRFGLGLPEHGRDPAAPLIWIHAVSVGEVLASRPVVSALRRSHPGHRLLLTTMTPGGAQVARREFADGVLHQLLPYDLPFAVNAFLERLRPAWLLLMETELWPNFLLQCQRRGIPVALVNARMCARDAALYQLRIVRPLLHRLMQVPALVMAQTRTDAERFFALGLPPERLHITGSLKYAALEGRPDPDRVHRRQALCARRPVWIAGSTHPGEESLLLQVHCELRVEFPELLLILAPRNVDRVASVERLCRKRGLCCTRLSQRPGRPLTAEVFLLDRLGELNAHYALADVAFVGGSLVPAGGHNVLEPLSQAVVALSGCHTDNFAGIIAELEQAGVLFEVANAQDLRVQLARLLAAPELRTALASRGREFVLQRRRETLQAFELLTEFIEATANTAGVK